MKTSEDIKHSTEYFLQRIAELEVSDIEFKQAIEALREGEEHLHQIIESTAVPIFVIDRNHMIIHWNKPCENLTGLSSKDMIGTKNQWKAFYSEQRPVLADLIVDSYPEEIIKKYYYDNYRMSELIQDAYESEGFFPDLGTEGRWLFFTAAPLKNAKGKVYGAVETLQDISDRKRAEEEIRMLNGKLETSVIELKNSIENLQKTQEQLIASEKMAALGRLVGGVAHEINTPVGIAVTAASLLEEKTRDCQQDFNAGRLKKSDLEKYYQLAIRSSEMILSNLRRASEFIHSFKQVAIDQSSGQKRKFNLRDYLQEMLLSLQPKFKKRQISINVNCNDDVELISYPGAFSQIVTNLVVNSLMHGFEQDEIGEILFNIRIEDDMLHFNYTDTGKGIDESVIKQIFEPFYTTKWGKGGSGMGLAVIYNLVTQTLSGTISCSSKKGDGVTFEIRIPLEKG